MVAPLTNFRYDFESAKNTKEEMEYYLASVCCVALHHHLQRTFQFALHKRGLRIELAGWSSKGLRCPDIKAVLWNGRGGCCLLAYVGSPLVRSSSQNLGGRGYDIII
jgi:hypothetical protein